MIVRSGSLRSKRPRFDSSCDDDELTHLSGAAGRERVDDLPLDLGGSATRP
jgi:hypothetical protein